MKGFITGAIMSLLSMSVFAQQPATATGNLVLDRLETVADLGKYAGGAQTVIVAGGRESGMFSFSKEKLNVDNGVVFAAANKSGYWVRMYDRSGAVDIAWFGAKMDSVTDDGPALKAAFNYPYVKISGPISLSSKNILPAGKTIEFTNGGAIYVTDTFDLKVNSYVKAGDYQIIFKGTGRVVLGNTSAAYVSACWFGATSDCQGFQKGKGTDNSAALKRAVYGAQKVSDLYLPPAAANTSYRITSTISIEKKLHFFSFRFHGGGTTITNSEGDRASKIFADFTEGGAINVQGSRRVYITDLVLEGTDLELQKLGNYSNFFQEKELSNPATFLPAGLKPNYAGITTDAEKDNKVWSADVVFERLQIQHFNIGIGISQAGHVQGDRMRVENTQINECTYGISVGQAQNRACHFYNVDMNRVWCGITNMAFGDHTGSVFQVTGGQWCHVYKCFQVQPSYLGQCVISGLYTEAIGMVGVFGDHNPNNSTLLFTGCYFFMQDNGLENAFDFAPPFYCVWAYGNVTFEGCNFWAARHYIGFYAGTTTSGYAGSTITMRGCSIHHCYSIHVKGNADIENTYLIPYSNVIDYSRSITVDFDAFSRINTGYSALTAVSTVETDMASNSKTIGNKQIIRKIPRFFTVQSAADKITDIKVQRDTVTFSYSRELQECFFRYVMPGEYIGTTLKDQPVTEFDNPAFIILSVDTINRKVKGKEFCSDVTFDKICLYTNAFFTTQPISGTIKKGSDKITEVTHTDKLFAGDYITFAESGRAYRIAAVDTVERSLRLFDAINEPVSDGSKVLFNEQLIDPAQPASTAPNNSRVRFVSSGTALSADDATVIFTNLTADVAVTLPAGVPVGHAINLKKLSGEHIATIVADHGLIDGKSSLQITGEYQGVQVVYDGKDYFVVGKY